MCSITLSPIAPRRSAFWCHRRRPFSNNIGRRPRTDRSPPSPLSFGDLIRSVFGQAVVVDLLLIGGLLGVEILLDHPQSFIIIIARRINIFSVDEERAHNSSSCSFNVSSWTYNDGNRCSYKFTIPPFGDVNHIFMPIHRAICRWNKMKIARTLRDDRHPAIIDFHSFIITPSYALIAMEYLPRLVPVEVREPKAKTWFESLLGGVAHLHARGIVHNDIKPANILLSRTEQAVLVDFGFAERYELLPGAESFVESAASFPTMPTGLLSPSGYHYCCASPPNTTAPQRV